MWWSARLTSYSVPMKRLAPQPRPTFTILVSVCALYISRKKKTSKTNHYQNLPPPLKRGRHHAGFATVEVKDSDRTPRATESLRCCYRTTQWEGNGSESETSEKLNARQTADHTRMSCETLQKSDSYLSPTSEVTLLRTTNLI